MIYLFVALGGALGAVSRFGVQRGFLAYIPAEQVFPVATMSVNIVGALIAGVLAGMFMNYGEAVGPWRLFMMTGFLGAFTTFSAFSLDALMLWQKGEILNATLYVAGSVVLSLIAVFIGLFFSSKMLA